MYKKIIYILLLIFFTSSCADPFSSVKRGITGEKTKSTDEFFIRKKDPLILPPDYENLPAPDETASANEEISNFEKTLGSTVEETNTSGSSVESSILRKIQSK